MPITYFAVSSVRAIFWTLRVLGKVYTNGYPIPKIVKFPLPVVKIQLHDTSELVIRLYRSLKVPANFTIHYHPSQNFKFILLRKLKRHNPYY